MFFNKSLVSIDIGSSTIKLIELSGNGAQRKLKNFAVESSPLDAFDNGNIVDTAAIAQCLKHMVTQLKLKGRFASVSISGGGVVLKRLRITVSSDSTLREQVDYHASQAFELDPVDLYYDYAEMSRTEIEGTHEVDVLLVGARREIVEQYVAVIKDSGLQLAVIEPSAISFSNMFELNYGFIESAVALISIGASHSQVSFIHGGRLLYSHTIPVGGEVYTSTIMQSIEHERKKAEDLKISASQNPAGMSPDLLRVMNETNALVSSDVRQVFSFFDAGGFEVGAVKYAFLTGGASRTFGLHDAIAAALGVPVNFANPFQRVQVSGRGFRLDQVMALGPVLGVAVGLGVRTKGDKVAA